MTVPELKSTVYLLPELTWPIIKQNVDWYIYGGLSYNKQENH